MSIRIQKSSKLSDSSFTNSDYTLLNELFTFSCKPKYNPKTRKHVPGEKITMMKSTDTPKQILLPMFLAKRMLKLYKEFEYVSTDVTPINIKDNIVLKDYQIDIYDKIYQRIISEKSTNTCIMNLFTGFGKTVLSAKLAAKLGVKTVVLIPGKSYINSWVTTFESFTDANVKVAPIPSKRNDKMDAELMDADVIISLSGRSKSIPEYIKRNLGLLIIDEVDTFCTNTRIGTMLEFEPKYILACTATLNNQNGSDVAVDIMCGEENKFIKKIDKPLSATFILTGIVPKYEKVNGIKSWPSLMESLMNNKKRNNYIVSLIRWKLNQNQKILILFSLVEHLEIISKLLTKNGISHGKIYGNLDEYQETMCLLGSTSKIGRGFDEKGFNENWNGIRISALIMCNTIKSESSFLQYVGRAERSDMASIYVLVDSDNSIKKHEATMKNILKRRGNVTIERIKA